MMVSVDGLVARARLLRRDMTREERKVWARLRQDGLGVTFRRQEPIERFVVDFVCYEHKLIVEIDGSQHAGSQQDAARDAWFAARGFRTLRFWNNEVTGNLDGVLRAIRSALDPTTA